MLEQLNDPNFCKLEGPAAVKLSEEDVAIFSAHLKTMSDENQLQLVSHFINFDKPDLNILNVLKK